MKVLALLVGLLLILSARAQRYFPDVPENRQLYRSLFILKREGLLIKSKLTADRFKSGPPLTRLQFAEIVARSIEALPTVLDNRIQSLRDSLSRGELEFAPDVYREEASEYVQNVPSCFSALEREFRSDIRELAVNPVHLQDTLKACKAKFQTLVGLAKQAVKQAGLTLQFEDVPRKHWAAEAIQELRDVGILVGYPDGKFRGGN